MPSFCSHAIITYMDCLEIECNKWTSKPNAIIGGGYFEAIASWSPFVLPNFLLIM